MKNIYNIQMTTINRYHIKWNGRGRPRSCHQVLLQVEI